MAKDEAQRWMKRAQQVNAQVAMHAIGDRGNRLVLDWYQELLAGDGTSAAKSAGAARRWRIEHAQVISPQDIPRFAQLGVIASMQPSHAIGDLYFAGARLGDLRLKGAYAWRSLLDAGATICAGSDAPVEKGDPLIEFYAAVYRHSLEGFAGPSWGLDQVVTRAEALRMLTWAPAYAVDIGDPEKLTFASKAIILNDTLNMPKSNLRLITGFPNLQFKEMLDPFSSNMTTDNWVNSLAGPVAFPTAGGLGGGGRGGLMSQNAYGAMEDKTVEWGGTNAGEAGGEQIGDLFFYDLPNFELKKGIRTYQSLFKFDSSYEHIYTWDIADQVDPSGVYRAIPANQPQVEEVWHTVKFKNSSGKPLTTAVATIFSKGELIGQTTLDYSAVGSDCKVRINKALDVRADANEEEVERQRGAIKDQYNNPKFDLVTVKGLLEVTNARKEEVQMTIVKNLTGEYLSGTGNPQQVKTTKGLRQMNPSMKLTWKPKVKGNGEKLRLEYSYKLYVPSN
jgi:hypothetical protein